MRTLVLGATGMLGSATFRELSRDTDLNVWGTLRDASGRRFFPECLQDRLISTVDMLDPDALEDLFLRVKPGVVINCVGLIKQLTGANDPLVVLPINSMLPHRLANLCEAADARLIHISTDCVFNGTAGMYTEDASVDAQDLYGRSKSIGEVNNRENVVTLRTSIIGHELNSQHALVDWFLSQDGRVKGFEKAIFSGLPTVELAAVIRDFVIPYPELWGLYHVSAAAIDKYSLLSLIAQTYKIQIEIDPDSSVQIDRSLDSSRFREATGYEPRSWPDLVSSMYQSHNQKA